MPGGSGRYQTALDALLGWVGAARPSPAAFRAAVERAHGRDAARSTLRVIERLGLVTTTRDAVALSEAGAAHCADPDPERLFERLAATWAGLLEALVLADTRGIEGAASQRLLPRLLGRRWSTPAQLVFRRNWLISLGLLERRGDRSALTPLGSQVLGGRAAEVAEIRKRIEDLLEEDAEADLARAEALEEDPDEPAPISAVIAREPDEPPAWSSDRLELGAGLVRPYTGSLELPEALLARAAAALSAGKHLLLVGAPGTGKTEIALALGEAARAEGYCRGVLTATGSADWTSFDTIGGYALGRDGALRFRPGVFLAAIERRSWLLVDEINRADEGRAFGELLTVLSGRDTTTPFALDDGRLVSVGPGDRCTHRVPGQFRVLATMNTWDRSSLFRLSYALERRFAVLHVGVPDDAGYARLVERLASERSVDPPLDPPAAARLLQLFCASGVLAHRPVGPAIAADMIRYLRRRGAPAEGLAEAIAMILLPQLEGLDDEAAAAVWALLAGLLAGWAAPRALAELEAHFRALFPGARISGR